MIDVDDPRWTRLCLGMLGAEEAEQLRLEAQETVLGRTLWDLFRPLPSTPVSTYVREQRAIAIEGRARYWEREGDEAWPEGARVTERAEDAAERCWYRAGALRRVARAIAEGPAT